MSDSYQTALYKQHIALNARMVDFAGWQMPVQYDGIIPEHQHCRQYAGIFDISHMGQIILCGKDAGKFMDYLCPADYLSLKINHQRYSQFCLANGGVIDDIMLLRLEEEKYLLVINASGRESDVLHLKHYINNFDVTMTFLDNHSLLALQGPQARHILSSIIPDIKNLYFMQGGVFTWRDINIIISCSGYSGEDGFEISIPDSYIIDFWEEITQYDNVKAIGLGARDSLRLEAGLPLYGHELSLDISPLEAGLRFSISAKKLADESRDYIGKSVLKQQYEYGTSRYLQAIKSSHTIPMRADNDVINSDNIIVGRITSGIISPNCQCPIALALIDSHSQNDPLSVKIRKHIIPVERTQLPFVKHNYYRRK